MAGVEKDVVVAAGKLGEVTIKVAVNPFDAANQLSTMRAALQHAVETAELCNDLCKDIVATAGSRISILCKLLAVGHVYSDQETELNAAMNRTLWHTVHALGEATELMYEYMSLTRVSRWNAAASTKDKMAEMRTYLINRFNDIQAHLQLSTWLKVKEGVDAVVPLVGAVEGVRRDLDALKYLHKADRSRVQAVAAAAAKRKRDKGQKVVVLDRGGWCLGVSVSPDGQWLATCGNDGRVTVWDAATGKHVRHLHGHTGPVYRIAWSPDGNMLATAACDRTARLWDAATGAPGRVLKGHRDWVRSVAWSPDGRQLCTGSQDSTARVWEVATGAVLHVLRVRHLGFVYCVAWSPDGSLVATALHDGSVRLWEAATGVAVRVLHGHTARVFCVAWSPDGTMLATASLDKTARVWDAATGTVKHTLHGHTNGIMSEAWSPDGRLLATGSDDATVRLWDAASGDVTRVIQDADGNMMTSVAWSPCGRLVFQANGGGYVRIYRAGVQQ